MDTRLDRTEISRRVCEDLRHLAKRIRWHGERRKHPIIEGASKALLRNCVYAPIRVIKKNPLFTDQGNGRYFQEVKHKGHAYEIHSDRLPIIVKGYCGHEAQTYELPAFTLQTSVENRILRNLLQSAGIRDYESGEEMSLLERVERGPHTLIKMLERQGVLARGLTVDFGGNKYNYFEGQVIALKWTIDTALETLRRNFPKNQPWEEMESEDRHRLQARRTLEALYAFRNLVRKESAK